MVDQQFDKLEAKFRYYEKLVKHFTKDSVQYLSSLKEFLKVQTIVSESIQEYYAENQTDIILKYVFMNSTVLNDIYANNVHLKTFGKIFFLLFQSHH